MKRKTTTTAPVDIRLLTIGEVAELLSFTTVHIRNMSRDGRFIKPIYLGTRVPRWRARDVQAWIDAKVDEANAA
jgi:predicted DNA-binding transcriptional regulator AlpA